MPCPSANPSPTAPSTGLTDFHRQHPHSPTTVYRPTTKAELVWAIQDAESRGLQARAIGTDMALSRAGYTDHVAIATDRLNRHVLQPFGASAGGLNPAVRLRDQTVAATALSTCVLPAVRARAPNLVFVEGGMKIKELLDDLSMLTPALAVPAMGAGSRQSIVGALATGTHGSENDRQPLIDAIRSVHLVGPGGQEWWIERSNRWSDPAMLAATVPGWCPDTIVRYDDDLFYSAIVGVGRLGVIYALVLEVEPEYWLLERRTPKGESWPTVLADLTASVSLGYDRPGGIFAKRNVTFFQVALNPNDLTTCWTTQRRRVPQDVPRGQGKVSCDPQAIFCNPSAPAWAAIGPAIDLVARPLLTAMAATPLLFPDPIIGTIGAIAATTWVNTTLSTIRNLFLTSPNLGAAVAAVLQQIPSLMVPLTNMIIGNSHQIPGETGVRHFKRGRSFEVLDQVDYTQPMNCYNGTGSEYFFNARSTGYLTFVSSVATLAQSLGGIPGYISLRFVPQTDAYLGMERFPLTVAVELSSVTPWLAADGYLRTAQTMAIAAGGIPHWGQKLIEPVGSAALYRSALPAFQHAVATIQDGHPATFSSPFSAAQALDPPALPLPAVAAAARPRVSALAVLAAGATLVPSAPAPKSVRAVAGLYAPSLRMNPGHDTLPVGRASVADRGVSVRDLARRLI